MIYFVIDVYVLIYRIMEEKREKIGGRKKGTPNKFTTETRKLFTHLVVRRFDKFEQDLNAIDDPYKRAKLFLEACKFVIPSLSSVQLEGEMKNTVIADRINDLLKED